MSKKIIYLLSLLMALSLVFASCKKNSTNPLGGGVQDENTPIHNEDGAGEGGLYDNFEDLPTDAPITKDPILKYSGDRGYRNPIGVVMGDKSDHVLVFTELRYQKTTADNDIGVDGATAADIYLTVSANSGTEGTFTEYGVIGTKDPKSSSTPENSHAAPVVFKVDAHKVVVVASGGVGISRVGTAYDQRPIKSKLDYCVVTLAEGTTTSGATITSTEWKELEVTYSGAGTGKKVQDAITYLNDTKGWRDAAGQKYGQFGTHSARGYVDGTSLVLPVVVANQGYTGKTTSTEYMGNIILVGASANPENPWTVVSYTTFNKGGGAYTKQKESRVIGKSGDKYQYLVVPNGSDEHKLTYGEAESTGEKKNNAPDTMSTFAAYDGSLGYLTLNWYGNGNYTPSTYKPNEGNQQSLLMHVKQLEYNPTIYLVQKGTINVSGKPAGWEVIDGGGAGKGSSIDVLGDGTVITVAEEKAPSGVRKFDIVYSRYSQSYLHSKIAQ